MSTIKMCVSCLMETLHLHHIMLGSALVLRSLAARRITPQQLLYRTTSDGMLRAASGSPLQLGLSG